MRPDFDDWESTIDTATHLSYQVWSGMRSLLTNTGNRADDKEIIAQTSGWKLNSVQDAL